MSASMRLGCRTNRARLAADFLTFVAICILVFPLAVAAQTLHYAGVQSVVGTLGTTGNGPLLVAVDGSAKVYYGRPDDGQVKMATPVGDGTYTYTLVTYVLGNLVGLGADDSGYVYIAEQDPGSGAVTIHKMIQSGGSFVDTPVSTNISSEDTVDEIAVDAAGDVYILVTGSDSQVIKETNTAGSYSQTVPITGLSTSAFALAVDLSGNLYITDSSGATKETLASGSYSASTVATGIGTADFVAVDAVGNVYLSDIAGTVIYKETPASGLYTQTIAVGLANPAGVAVDIAGILYVASPQSTQVFKELLSGADFGSENVGSTHAAIAVRFLFDTAGTIAAPIVVTQGAPGLDYSATTGSCISNGTSHSYSAGDYCTVNVTFAPGLPGERIGAVLLKNDSATPLATGYMHGYGIAGQPAFLPGTQSAPVSGFSGDAGVAVDGSGNLYVADSYNNQVFKETLSAGTYTQSLVASGLNYPNGLAVDGAGNVYIADAFDDQVLMESPSGSSYVQTVIGTGLSHPYGVAVDGVGNVYIADSSNNRVLMETLSGGTYTQSTIAGGLNQPFGVAVDGTGNVYIADTSNQTVLKETLASGTYSQSVVVASGSIYPYGLAVDAVGNLYYADPLNNRVMKEQVSGSTYIESTIGTGLSSPFNIAFDGHGNAYIADAGNNRVAELDIADAPSLTFATTAVGATSSDSPQTVTFANIGTASLLFPVPSSGGNPTISPSFTLDSSAAGACPAVASGGSAGSVTAGASCTFSIGFLPTTSGSLTGSVVIWNNALNAVSPNYATQTISLAGMATALPASQTAISGVPPMIYAGGNLGTVTVTLEDVNGNVASGSTASVTVTITGPNGYSHASTVTAVAGMATFNLSSLNLTTPGSYTVTATSGSLTASSANTTVSLPPTQTALAGVTPALLSGGHLGTVTVSIENVNGQVVTSETPSVTVTITGPYGYSHSVTSRAVSGVAAFDLSSFTLSDAGVYTVTATSTSLSSSSAQTTVSALASIISLSASTNAAAQGSPVVLTATATVGGAPATPGQVSFNYQQTVNGVSLTGSLGTGSLTSAGTSLLTVRPGAGTYVVTVSFAGTQTVSAATSSPQTLTITGQTPSPTTSTISAIGTPGQYTLQGTVSTSGRHPVPTGSFSFVDVTAGSSSVGAGTLDPSTLAYVAAPTGSSPLAVANVTYTTSGDLNGDGIADLISLQSASAPTLQVQLGLGNGLFAVPTTYTFPTGAALTGVRVADVNNDGKADLIVNSQYQYAIFVLLGDGTGNFTVPSAGPQILSVESPDYIVVADLNHDGNLDLVSGDPAMGIVNVFLGNGDGSFQAQAAYASGGLYPIGIAVADFNHDGIPDLVVCNADYNFAILLGNGDGSFQAPQITAFPTNPGQPSVASLRGNGVMDVVVPYGSNYRVYLGNNDGTFAAPLTAAVNYPIAELDLADQNNDGKLDLVAVGSNSGSPGRIMFRPGNGDGSFGTEQDFTLEGQGSGSFSLTDLDGDGIADFAIANTLSGDISIFLSHQSIAATATGISVPGPTTQSVEALYSGDSNYASSTSTTIPLQPDTSMTILSATPPTTTPNLPITLVATVSSTAGGPTTGGTVSFYSGSTLLGTVNVNSGTASYTLSAGLPLGYTLITATYSGAVLASSNSNALRIFIGPQSTTSLALSTTTAAIGVPVTLTATALTSVGSGPITPGQVTFNYQQTLNGVTLPGSFGTVQLTSAGTATLTQVPGVGTYVITAIFAGNGQVGTSSSTPQTLTVSGSGSYATSSTLASSGTVGDYTLTATVNTFGLLPPTGTVSFLNTTNANAPVASAPLDPATAIASLVGAVGSPITNINVLWVATGDFNNDGTPDIATVASGGVVTTELGNGDGTFQTANTYSLGAGDIIAVGDVNNDGKQDLLVLSISGATVTILTGNGDGTFNSGSPQVLTTGNNPTSMTLADLNQDGNLDIIVTNQADNTAGIFQGTASGIFQTQATSLTGAASSTGPAWVTAADVNGDSIPDLIISNNSSHTISILKGIGDGTFQQLNEFYVQYANFGERAGQIAVGSLRNNGIMDLVVTGTLAGAFYTYLGNNDGTFGPAAVFGNYGNAGVGVLLADVNHDGKLDLVGTESNSALLAIFNGVGDGTFGPEQDYPVNAQGIYNTATADLNHDGLPDFVTADYADGGGDNTILLDQQSFSATATAVYVTGTGTQNVDASYPGDTTHLASLSPTVPLQISVQAASNTMIAASTTAIAVGGSVTFTATVLPLPTGPSLGIVSFYNGTTLLGTASVNAGGVATYATLALPVGIDAITAIYSGNAALAISSSGILSISVTQATSIQVSATSATSVYGQPVTLSANINPVPGVSGTVTFYSGTTVLGTSSITSQGTASFTLTTLPVGTDSITAVYSGSAPYVGSTSSVFTITIAGISTATAVTSSNLNPSAGQSIVLSATVTPASTDSAPGTVSFYSGTTLLGNGSLNTSGVATLNISTLPAGVDAITAVYSGSATFAGSTSSALSISVSGAVTTTVVTSSNPTVMYGQSVVITATITPASTDSARGMVNFYAGATLLGSGVLSSSGVATLTASTLPSGINAITAVYSGSATFAPSTSSALSITVSALATATAVTSSSLTPGYGQAIVLTATVKPAPTDSVHGTITFYTGSMALGTATLGADGTATFSTAALPLGTDTVTAVYSGSADYSTSTSGGLSISALAMTTVGFSASPTTQLYNNPIVLSAQVSSAIIGVLQTGTVNFLDGSTLVGSTTVGSNGIAVFSTSSLGDGNHNLTATYSGDSNYMSSASTGAPVSITVGDLNLALGGDNNKTVAPGAAVTYNFPLSPVVTSTFIYDVTLTASGLPPGATYSFSPATIPAGSGTLPVAFSIQTSAATAMGSAPINPSAGGFSAKWLSLAFGLLLPLAGSKSIRKRLHALPQSLMALLLAALSLGFVSGLVGCGAGGLFTQQTKTYTITISATSASLVRATTVQLNLK